MTEAALRRLAESVRDAADFAADTVIARQLEDAADALDRLAEREGDAPLTHLPRSAQTAHTSQR